MTEDNNIYHLLLTNPPSAAELQALPPRTNFEKLSGPLPYRMTNDALFHIVFSTNQTALKGLLCSLLHKQPDDIISIDIQSPLIFGPELLSKKFIMDLKILLNDDTIINIEMQVASFPYWKERSMNYLCKAFGNLKEGDPYEKTKQTIHIGILDFNLFDGEPVFYNTFYLSSDTTHEIYSDKLRLSVLQLSYRNMATPEDKFWHLDEWAAFFKAATWEEVITLAQNNPAIAEASKTMQSALDDIRIQHICECRIEGERTWLSYEEYLRKTKKQLDDTAQQLDNITQQLDDATQQLDDTTQQLNDTTQQLNNATQQLNNATQQLADAHTKYLSKIQRKLDKGLSLEQIAAELEEDITDIQKACEELLGVR